MIDMVIRMVDSIRMVDLYFYPSDVLQDSNNHSTNDVVNENPYLQYFNFRIVDFNKVIGDLLWITSKQLMVTNLINLFTMN